MKGLLENFALESRKFCFLLSVAPKKTVSLGLGFFPPSVRIKVRV